MQKEKKIEKKKESERKRERSADEDKKIIFTKNNKLI